MIGLVLVLVLCVAVLGMVAGPVLRRAAWVQAHPGAAVACWMCATLGVAVALGGLMLLAVLAPPGPGHEMLEWLHDCLPHHSHPWAALAVAGTAIAAGLCYVGLVRGVPPLWHAVRRTRAHREILQIVAREDPEHGDVLLIDHPVPIAYCMPVRHRPIVMSTGAVERLEPQQIAAVLAHERKHLRQRHHLMLAAVDLAYAMLPWLPTMRLARRHLPPLLEMTADDAAVRWCGGPALTQALEHLTLLPGPDGSLAGRAAGTTTRTRQARLHSARSAPRGIRAVALATSTMAIAGPLAIAIIATARIPLPC